MYTVTMVYFICVSIAILPKHVKGMTYTIIVYYEEEQCGDIAIFTAAKHLDVLHKVYINQ